MPAGVSLCARQEPNVPPPCGGGTFVLTALREAQASGRACRPSEVRTKISERLTHPSVFDIIKGNIKDGQGGTARTGGAAMNIGIDIDDTITDTFDYLMPFVAEFFGADLRELKARGISYSNLPEEWKGREIEFCKKYYDKVVPGYFSMTAASVSTAFS